MSNRPRNAFLAGLNGADYASLTPHLTPVDLVFGTELHHSGERVRSVIFPTDCLISLVVHGRSGELEASLVGNEGCAGLVEACGAGSWGVGVEVQVGGPAQRCPADLCVQMALSSHLFARQAWRLAEMQINENRQSAYCQARHTIDGRFARWVLESIERSGHTNPLPVTHEFLSFMLGVQRTTVTRCALAFQERGLIRYRRGQINVVDFVGLERRACECRGRLVQDRARLGFCAIRSQPDRTSSREKTASVDGDGKSSSAPAVSAAP